MTAAPLPADAPVPLGTGALLFAAIDRLPALVGGETRRDQDGPVGSEKSDGRARGTGLAYGDARARELMVHRADAPMSFGDYLEHVHEDDRQLFAATITSVVAGDGDGRLDIQYRIRPRGEGVRWLNSRAQPVKRPAKRRRLVGTVRHITAEKAAATIHPDLDDQLRSAAAARSNTLATRWTLSTTLAAISDETSGA